jgi:hypothetical protein
MQRWEFWLMAPVTDDALERGLFELLQSSGRTDARVLAHLAEVEERRLHLSAGFGSLFEYCLKRLGLSEDEACRRITAARLARRFPAIFELIEQRRIHLTGVGLLRHFLTYENHRELLVAACGKSRRQIEALLATRFPQADVDTFVRRLPDRGTFANVEQRSAETFRIQLNASKQLKEKLELACDLLSHAEPRREFAKVIERGLDLLIEKTERDRFGKTSKAQRRKPSAQEPAAVQPTATPTEESGLNMSRPKPIDAVPVDGVPGEASVKAGPARESDARSVAAELANAPPADERIDTVVEPDALPALGRGEQSRTRVWIARATRREVAARDGETCSFVGSDGHRCGGRAFLQLHHQQAWARGGGDEAQNLQWFCAAHNRLAAEQDFGRALVAEAIRRGAG